MTDTPLDLAAIEAREQAATGGGWTVVHEPEREEGNYTVPALIYVASSEHPDGFEVCRVSTDHEDDPVDVIADAEFIAHARTDVPALVAALRDAQAEVARLRKPHRACEACGCDGCEYCQDEALIVRAEKAEAQVAAVLALCDEAAPRRMGDGYLSASVLAPEDVRAAVDGAS